MIVIVAGHCLYYVPLIYDCWLEKVAVNLLKGGTSLFVFISGFLFHHVFYQRFTYRRFVTSKVKNLLIPYLLLGVAKFLPCLR